MPSEESGEKDPNRRKHRWPRRNRINNGVLGISAFINAYRHEQKANRHQEKREDRCKALRDYLTLLFVVLTTVGIGIQACVLHNSDVTFKETLIAQKLSSERQLRAYVYVKPPPEGVKGVSVGGTPSAVIAVRNAGQTPAYKMYMRGNIGINAFPIAPEKVFFEGPYGGSMVLPPETETSTGGRVGTQDKFAQPELDAIIDGKNYRLYLFGTISYEDAFGIARTSDYCFAYFGQGPTLTQMDYCNRHTDQN